MASTERPATRGRGLGESHDPAGAAARWQAELEVRHLRALVALVDRGSMTAAARELGVAQSTVSETVAALERVLGTAAVARRSGLRGVELTAAGRALLPHARRTLAGLREAQVAVAAVSREARLTVQVIANESLATYLLPPALALVRRQWPQTQFTVTVSTCAGVREGVARGSHDLGLFLQAARGAAGEARAAGDDQRALVLAGVRLALFAGAEHPLLAEPRAELTRARLAPYTLFSSDASGDFHSLLERFFAAGPAPGPRFESVGSVEAVKRSVAADRLALGVLPAYSLADQLGKGTFRTLPLRPALPRLRLAALLAGQPEIPACADLVEALRTLVAGGRGGIPDAG